jgi:ADP-heptose:LPS heptosyltransferase
MKILIIHTYGLGDTIMFTPALKLLQETYPQAQIDFVVFQKHSQYPIKECDRVNRIYEASFDLKSLYTLINTLRHTTYTYIFHTSGTQPLKMALFMFFLKSGQKIGEYGKIKFPWYSRGINTKNIQKIHRVSSNEQMIQTVLKSTKTYDPFYCLNAVHLEFADHYFNRSNAKHKLSIGIHPGCNEKFAYKRWEIEKYITLILKLYGVLDCEVFIFIGPDEIKEGERIKKEIPSVHIVQEALNDTAALISKMQLMITNDSGLGHIASCFQTKTFTIFSKTSITNVQKVKPYSKHAYSVDFRELHTDDEVETVFQALKEII